MAGHAHELWIGALPQSAVRRSCCTCSIDIEIQKARVVVIARFGCDSTHFRAVGCTNCILSVQGFSDPRRWMLKLLKSSSSVFNNRSLDWSASIAFFSFCIITSQERSAFFGILSLQGTFLGKIMSPTAGRRSKLLHQWCWKWYSGGVISQPLTKILRELFRWTTYGRH